MIAADPSISIHDLMDSSGVRFGTSGVRGPVAAMLPELCFAYTLAFLQGIPVTAGRRVAMAMDLRPSSPQIAAACAAAVRHSGLRLDFCGAIPTPALACYAQVQGISALMITGSHIPFDRNGIKFYGPAGEITKADEAAISRAAIALPRTIVPMPLPEPNPAAAQLYLDRYLEFFPPGVFSGMRLGLFEHSSVARDLLRSLLQALGAEVLSLGRTDDFVPIDTEALTAADVQQALAWAAEPGFDAILSTDGDADRPLLGDERGQWLRGDIVGLLCAQYLGARSVVAPVSCNTAIELCGAFPAVARTRIGSPHVIDGMQQMIASGLPNVVGFEANGGFLLGSRIEKNGRALMPLMTRDAVLPMLSLLALARQRGCKVSELADGLPQRYTASDRIQSFAVDASWKLLLDLSAYKSPMSDLLDAIGARAAALDQTDGLRILLDNAEIVHFRPSGNAPELRCYAEAATQQRANWLVQTCLRLLQEGYVSAEVAQHGEPVAGVLAGPAPAAFPAR